MNSSLYFKNHFAVYLADLPSCPSSALDFVSYTFQTHQTFLSCLIILGLTLSSGYLIWAFLSLHCRDPKSSKNHVCPELLLIILMGGSRARCCKRDNEWQMTKKCATREHDYQQWLFMSIHPLHIRGGWDLWPHCTIFPTVLLSASFHAKQYWQYSLSIKLSGALVSSSAANRVRWIWEC